MVAIANVGSEDAPVLRTRPARLTLADRSALRPQRISPPSSSSTPTPCCALCGCSATRDCSSSDAGAAPPPPAHPNAAPSSSERRSSSTSPATTATAWTSWSRSSKTSVVRLGGGRSVALQRQTESGACAAKLRRSGQSPVGVAHPVAGEVSLRRGWWGCRLTPDQLREHVGRSLTLPRTKLCERARTRRAAP
jgi:hypothetical protein